MKFMNKIKFKKEDLEKYALKTKQDFEILEKIYQLEEGDLDKNDEKLVKFIRTQLEDDWRTPIVKLLDQMLKG